MNEKYSWKRTEDIELDLTDFLSGLFRRWKQFAAFALIFSLLLGGYGWMKGGDGKAKISIMPKIWTGKTARRSFGF